MRILSLLALAVLPFSLVSCNSLDSPSGSEVTVNHKKVSSGPVKTVKTTAYTHTEADHIAYRKKTAIGTQLRYYNNIRSAAADWSRYPLGTRFQIVGSPVVYEIDDYGSALVGKDVIDLYKPSRAHMNRWGARNVKIKVLRWGSFRKSLEIMKPRMKYRHVRKMVRAIEDKVG